MIEEAEIEDQKNFSEQMDEIIRNNDKFETISVLISVLCRELGIQVTNQPGVIGHAIKKVYDDYYKSMEDWKNLTKQGLKHDIRQ